MSLHENTLALLNAETERRAEIMALDWEGNLCKEHTPENLYVPPELDEEGRVVRWHCRHGRPNQMIPNGRWTKWVLMGGRGMGKTRTLTEAGKKLIMAGEYRRPALWGRTSKDIRDTLFEGVSGFKYIFPRSDRPTHNEGKNKIVFPNGCEMLTYSAEEPDQGRGPEHDLILIDELAAWKSPDRAWNALIFSLRNGLDPKIIAATTPKPIALLQRLSKDASCRMTRGSTYDNLYNLAPTFAHEILSAYRNTRLERQEIMGELLEDIEGSFWTTSTLDRSRWRNPIQDKDGVWVSADGIIWTLDNIPDIERIVVAVDVATTHGEESHQTGIAVEGKGVDGRGYVFDCIGVRASPTGWSDMVISKWQEWGANVIVVEDNQGGEMTEAVIRQAAERAGVSDRVTVIRVHAAKDKGVRAGPVVGRYDNRRISHVGVFKELEAQMVVFPIDHSVGDDLVDALVHADNYLFPPPMGRTRLVAA
jgi:predicted phage terminase large subunit-like protein